MRLTHGSMSAKVFHIPFIGLTPGLKLCGIVQRSPKEGNSAPKDHPKAKHYTEARELLADPEVDVIVVTTPPDNHFELTKAALEAGKHVLTEKPFVPTSAEADKLIAIADANKRLICVFQNRRWDSDFLALQHVLSQGTLGRIMELDTHYDRYRPAVNPTWKGSLGVSAGGSAIFDLGSHLIDQVYVLFGMPQSVHGRLLAQRRGEVDLETPDGVLADFFYPHAGSMTVHVRISSLSAEADQPRFWVRGTAGSFRTTGVDTQEDQLKAGQVPGDVGFGAPRPGSMKMTLAEDDGARMVETDVPGPEPETYLAFYKQFAAALASGRDEDVPVKASQARDVLRIIEAIVESAKTGDVVKF